MSVVAPGVVHAGDLSTAWLETVWMVTDATDQKMCHSTTTITDPQAEDAAIRARVDNLLATRGNPGVVTVANTIFPAALAASSDDTTQLVQRYRALYPRLRRYPGNRDGTYFGRIVDHPDLDAGDQLSLLVTKLGQEATLRGPKSARYEVAVSAPEEDLPLLVRRPRDSNPMGFPCLSMCSFQLDRGRLHLLATYRYEYLVVKGYGNYLGLARLQSYVAAQAGLQPGQLTVVAGRVRVDASRRQLSTHLNSPQHR